MSFPYAFLKVLKGEKANIDTPFSLPKEQAQFFLQDGNMCGQYLGACLDSCRWGSATTVMWEMNVNEIIGFIQNWMQQNNQKFQELFHERKIEELYTKFELPHVHHDVCPANKTHTGTINDFCGRVRCAHKSEKKFKPSYVVEYSSFNPLSQTREIVYFDCGIASLLDSVDEDNFEERLRIKREYNLEEPTFVVTDVCYAILSDKDVILPLETIIKRMNLRPEIETVYCPEHSIKIGHPCTPERISQMSKEEKKNYDGWCHGHSRPTNKIEFPFDGWTLAFYVQKWYEQLPEGKAPLFDK